MHSVCGRRVQDAFEWAEFGNPFGMNPELIEQIDRERDHDHERREAERGERHEEDKHERYAPRPAQAIRRGEREFVGRVMHAVGKPPKAYAVARAMKPVVRKLEREKEHNIRWPIAEIPINQAMLIEPKRAGQSNRERNEIADATPDGNEERREIAFPVVVPLQHESEHQRLNERS